MKALCKEGNGDAMKGADVLQSLGERSLFRAKRNRSDLIDSPTLVTVFIVFFRPNIGTFWNKNFGTSSVHKTCPR